MERLTFLSVLAPTLLLTLTLGSQAPPTPEQVLSASGVQLSTQSLRDALHNPSSKIRNLAAFVLSQRGDTASIPNIEQLLSDADDPLERQNLAEALILFRAPEGFAAMREICANEKLREDRRIIAAVQLSDAKDDSCVPYVATILAATTDSSTRYGAMDYLKRHAKVTPELERTIKSGLENALLDQVPANRANASELIASFRISGATPALRAAVNAEPDNEVRARMENSLTKLTSAPQPTKESIKALGTP